MKYLLYPGCCCATKASGKGYDLSLHADFDVLGVSWEELEDWNCCGATMYMSVDEEQAFAMAARNLALAEQQGGNGADPPTLMASCAACYAVLNKTQHYMEEYPQVGNPIREALEEAKLSFHNHVKVRHPLDVIVNDVGLEKVSSQVKNPLEGVRVACYYGCLLVRPYAEFDDPHHPTSMDRLMEAIGAEPVDWSLKTRCCGGALTGTITDVGMRLSYIILAEAIKQGADVIATACPFCQFNLECFQKQMAKTYKLESHLPVAYFSQILGTAFGLPPRKIGLQHLFRPLPFAQKYVEQEHHAQV